MCFSGLPELAARPLATAAWGWHAETGLHVLRLAAKGVFARHPNLQIVVGHMGENLPFWLMRADAVLGKADPDAPSVAAVIREHVHITICGYTTTPPLLCALQVFGADRIMFAATTRSAIRWSIRNFWPRLRSVQPTATRSDIATRRGCFGSDHLRSAYSVGSARTSLPVFSPRKSVSRTSGKSVTSPARRPRAIAAPRCSATSRAVQRLRRSGRRSRRSRSRSSMRARRAAACSWPARGASVRVVLRDRAAEHHASAAREPRQGRLQDLAADVVEEDVNAVGGVRLQLRAHVAAPCSRWRRRTRARRPASGTSPRRRRSRSRGSP